MTIELLFIIISFITSYFKKFLIIFINVIIIDFSFYFKSLFNNIKPFKNNFL